VLDIVEVKSGMPRKIAMLKNSTNYQVTVRGQLGLHSNWGGVPRGDCGRW